MSLEKFLKTGDLVDLLQKQNKPDHDLFSGKPYDLSNRILSKETICVIALQAKKGLGSGYDLFINQTIVDVPSSFCKDIYAALSNERVDFGKHAWQLFKRIIFSPVEFITNWNLLKYHFSSISNFFWYNVNRRKSKRNISSQYPKFSICWSITKGVLVFSAVILTTGLNSITSSLKNDPAVKNIPEKESFLQIFSKPYLNNIPLITTTPRGVIAQLQDLCTAYSYVSYDTEFPFFHVNAEEQDVADFFAECLFSVDRPYCRKAIIDYLTAHEHDLKIDEFDEGPFYRVIKAEENLLENEFEVPIAQTFLQIINDNNENTQKIVKKWVVNRRKNPRKAWALLAGAAFSAYNIDKDRALHLNENIEYSKYAPALFDRNTPVHEKATVSQLQKLVYSFVETKPTFINASQNIQIIFDKYLRDQLTEDRRGHNLIVQLLEKDVDQLKILQTYLGTTDTNEIKLNEWINNKTIDLANNYNANFAITTKISTMNTADLSILLDKTKKIDQPSRYFPYLDNLQLWLKTQIELHEINITRENDDIPFDIKNYETSYWHSEDKTGTWYDTSLQDLFASYSLFGSVENFNVKNILDSYATYISEKMDIFHYDVYTSAKYSAYNTFFKFVTGVAISKVGLAAIGTVTAATVGAVAIPAGMATATTFFAAKDYLIPAAYSIATQYYHGYSNPVDTPVYKPLNTPNPNPNLSTPTITTGYGAIVSYPAEQAGSILTGLLAGKIMDLAKDTLVLTAFNNAVSKWFTEEDVKIVAAITAVELAIKATSWYSDNPILLRNNVVNSAVARSVVYYLYEKHKATESGIIKPESEYMINIITMGLYGMKGFESNYLQDYRFIFVAIGKQSEVISQFDEFILTPALSLKNSFLEISTYLFVVKQLYRFVICSLFLKQTDYLPRRSIQFQNATLTTNENMLLKLLQLMYSITHRNFLLLDQWLKSENAQANIFAGILLNMDFSTAYPITYIERELTQKEETTFNKQTYTVSVDFRLDFFNNNDTYQKFMEKNEYTNLEDAINKNLQVKELNVNKLHIGIWKENKNEVVLRFKTYDFVSKISWPRQNDFDEQIINNKQYTDCGNNFLVCPVGVNLTSSKKILVTPRIYQLTEVLMLDPLQKYTISGILKNDGCWSKISVPDNFGNNPFLWHFFDDQDKLKITQKEFPHGNQIFDGVLLVLYSRDSSIITSKTDIETLFESYVTATVIRLQREFDSLQIIRTNSSNEVDLTYHKYEHPLCVITAFVLQTMPSESIDKIVIEIKRLRSLIILHFNKELNDIASKSNFTTDNNELYKLDQLAILEFLCKTEKVNLKLVTYINTSIDSFAYKYNLDDKTKILYMGYVRPTLYWADSHFIPMVEKTLLSFENIDEKMRWDFYKEDSTSFSWNPFKKTKQFISKFFT